MLKLVKYNFFLEKFNEYAKSNYICNLFLQYQKKIYISLYFT